MTDEQRQEIIDNCLRFGAMVWVRPKGEDKPRKGVVAKMFSGGDTLVFFEPDGRDSAYRFHKEFLAIRKPGDDVWSWLTEPACPYCGSITDLNTYGVTPTYCLHCHEHVADDNWLPSDLVTALEPEWTPKIGDHVQLKADPRYQRSVIGVTPHAGFDLGTGDILSAARMRDEFEPVPPSPAKSKHKGESSGA